MTVPANKKRKDVTEDKNQDCQADASPKEVPFDIRVDNYSFSDNQITAIYNQARLAWLEGTANQGK